jgi:hypothetical protein
VQFIAPETAKKYGSTGNQHSVHPRDGRYYSLFTSISAIEFFLGYIEKQRISSVTQRFGLATYIYFKFYVYNEYSSILLVQRICMSNCYHGDIEIELSFKMTAHH